MTSERESTATTDAKHTPGPWTSFYKRKYDEWHVSLPVEGASLMTALCPDGIQSPNREADARLIAAAPKMLEALKHAKQFLEYRFAKQSLALPGNPLPTAYATICAAIAQAEGRDL